MTVSVDSGDRKQIDDRVWAARPVFVYNAEVPESVGSIPMHALIPARHIGAKALYFAAGDDPGSFLDRHRPKIVIITKAFDDGPLNLAREAKRRDIRVICTVCDLHIADEGGIAGHGSGQYGRRNDELFRLADAVVAPTAQVKKFTEEFFGRACLIIEEPVEYPRRPPRFSPDVPVRVLWTGHPNNHDTLADGIRALSQFRRQPLSLMIVSSAPPALDELSAIAPNMKIGVVSWSPLVQFSMLDKCDVVFVPSRDLPVKQAKGQARLVGALQAGRVAIVHPLPQYQELADYCYCSRDYAKSLDEAMANPAEAIRRIEAGQRCIDARFSQEACADKWRTLIGSLV
jgi:hypothetical protein